MSFSLLSFCSSTYHVLYFARISEIEFVSCREYLATFKKTVAMHEMFLTRLAHHPVFRNDHNLRVFLEYDQDLCVRGNISMLYMT